MARSKISPDSQETDATEIPSSALAQTQSGSVGAPEGYNPDHYDDTARDTDIPVVALVNNVGNLAKEFRGQQGKFVLGELVLGDAVDVIPVAVVKFFVERFRDGREIKHGTPEYTTRKMFQTASEAARQGYIVDFSNSAPNRIEEAGRIGYLVIAPNGTPPDSTDFVLKPTGYRAAIAKCSYQRGGFRGVFRPIFDHASKLAQLKDVPTKGLNHSELFNKAQAWDFVWSLTSKECTGKENFWFEPRIARKTKLTAETVAWISENYGAIRA